MDAIGSATSASSSASGSSATKLAENFDTFLTLLTTQLQNQDPLSPLDSNQFTEQLVQFSQVEQSIATNTNLEQALALLQTNNTANAVNYIGKTVETVGGTNALVDGSATWRYAVPAAAKTVSLVVSDASGRVVYAGKGNADVGQHDFVWNGKDNAGSDLPEGTYSLTVSAVDGNGDSVDTAVSALGVVTGLRNGTNGPELLLGNTAIPVDLAIEVHSPAKPTDG